MQIWRLTTIFVAFPPPHQLLVRVYDPNQGVHVCVCWKERCREEKGIVIELGVMEFTGEHGRNHLPFKRPLSNRHALQFGWSISPTGRNVNSTHTDFLCLQKDIIKDKPHQHGVLELLGVASGSPFVAFIGVKRFARAEKQKSRALFLLLFFIFSAHAECLTSAHLLLVESAEYLPAHTNLGWFSLRLLLLFLPARPCRQLMAFSEFTCSPWCW